MTSRLKVGFIITAILIFISDIRSEELSLQKKDWVSTGASNSLTPDQAIFQFRRAYIRTLSDAVNVHSHYRRKNRPSLKNYTYTGQMRLASADGGIGVTFHSRYKNADKYYRLRYFPGGPGFHIAPHPDGVQLITAGDADSDIIPAPGTWYNFKVLVRTMVGRTRIRAKVWQAGVSQPRWQIDCSDTSDIRIRGGKVGIWSMGTGEKRWRKLAVSELLR